MRLTVERKWKYYICGRCNTPIEYLPDEDPPIPCPDCGYAHKDKDYRDIPEEIKLKIS